MDENKFKMRPRKFALDIIRLVEDLPKSKSTDVIGRQIIRSATSVGANYRSACRAQSPADMIAKLKLVEEEADESIYWLELLVEADIIPAERSADLSKEANELLAMTVASIKTLRKKSASLNPKPPIANRQS